jgi:hypothetical protein
METLKTRKRNQWIFGLLLILLLGFGWCPAYHYWDNRNGTASEIDQILLIEQGRTSVLVSVEKVFHTTRIKSSGSITVRGGYDTWRLTSIDATTGTKIAREVIGDRDERIGLLGSIGEDVWCFSYDPAIGLHARNPRTLQVTKENPAPIKGGGWIGSDYISDPSVLHDAYGIDSTGRYIIAATVDGHFLVSNPNHVDGARELPRDPRRFGKDPSQEPLSRSMKNRDGTSFVLQGQPRQEILSDRAQLGNPTSIDPTITFLSASFLIARDRSDGHLRNIDSSGSLYILHRDRIGNDAGWMLSRVQTTGGTHVEWNIKLERDPEEDRHTDRKVHLATLHGDMLVLVLGTWGYGVDVKRGKMRWVYRF